MIMKPNNLILFLCITILLIVVGIGFYSYNTGVLQESFETKKKIFPPSKANALENTFNSFRSYALLPALSDEDKEKMKQYSSTMKNVIQEGIDANLLTSAFQNNVINYLLSPSTLDKLMDSKTPFLIKKGLLKKLNKWIQFIKNNTTPVLHVNYSVERPSSVNENEISVSFPNTTVELYSAGSKNASNEGKNIKDFDPGKDDGGYNLFRMKTKDEDSNVLKSYKIRQSCLRRIPGTPVRYGEIPNALDLVNGERANRYKAEHYFTKPRLIMVETVHGKNSLNNYAAKYYLNYTGESSTGDALYEILAFDMQERTFSKSVMVNYDGSITSIPRDSSVENTLFVLEQKEQSGNFDFVAAEDTSNTTIVGLRSYGYKGLKQQNHYFYQYYSQTGGNIEKVVDSSSGETPYIFKYISVQH